MKLDSAVFYTSSINTIVAFYRDVIGFSLEYQDGDDYASFIFENGARLGIQKSHREREIVGSQTAIISTDNIDELYQAFKAKKVTIFKEIYTAGWGITFSILDPDKNRIEFLKRNWPEKLK
jgi:predicted enzyme related to lactoylglutathione lyase